MNIHICVLSTRKKASFFLLERKFSEFLFYLEYLSFFKFAVNRFEEGHTKSLYKSSIAIMFPLWLKGFCLIRFHLFMFTTKMERRKKNIQSIASLITDQLSSTYEFQRVNFHRLVNRWVKENSRNFRGKQAKFICHWRRHNANLDKGAKNIAYLKMIMNYKRPFWCVCGKFLQICLWKSNDAVQIHTFFSHHLKIISRILFPVC